MNIFKTATSGNTLTNSATINIKTNETETNKFQAMHTLVENQLSSYLDEFRQGNIDNLNEQFTVDNYQRYGTILANNNIFNSTIVNAFPYDSETFNNYRNTFHRVLDGLNLAILNNNILLNTNEELTNVKNILNDPELLANYYNTRYLTNNIGGLSELNSNVPLTPIEISQEYILYVERYGIPDNLVFDSEKLSAIILELQNS
jgi:hypothetical protein|tara:strand:- start:38 stop:646 length:609 start_codon:yes stop_codon:yes gene_type:complete